MILPYLLLAEANLGLGRLQAAEEFLSLANWSVLKSPACPNAIRAQTHRNFGKLYSAQGKLTEALQELAKVGINFLKIFFFLRESFYRSKDVYCSSLEFGPEHVVSIEILVLCCFIRLIGSFRRLVQATTTWLRFFMHR